MLADKPNLLYIVVDCLRADKAFEAGRSAHTPNLHALAEKGTLFTHLISSNSVTVTCMTTTFTGLYPQKHGVRSMLSSRVGDDIPLLAEILRANGYHTYAEASGPLSPYFRLNRGFDQYNLRDGVKHSFLGEWGDNLIASFAGGKFQEPWFVYLHLWGVHQPRQISPEFDKPEYGKTQYDRAVTSYDHRLGDLFKVVGDRAVIMVTGDHGEKVPENAIELRADSMRNPISRDVAAKHPMLFKARRQLASARRSWYGVVRNLYRFGLVKNPLMSVTGHGYHVYDSLTRVPFVVGGHKTDKPGRLVVDQVRQVDIMPTILDLAGLAGKTPDDLDGRSLTPFMRGETLPPLPAFIETCQNASDPSDFYGVRADGWKFACNVSDPKVPAELYDLSADPAEENNLARVSPDKAAEMRRLLDGYLAGARKTESVALTEELNMTELEGLTSHLRKLGYVD